MSNRILGFVLSAGLLLHRPVAVQAAGSYDEEDYWWDTQEYTELWNFIEARRWNKAVSRVRSHPDEASILVLRRERTGRVYEKSLPLHKVFAVDFVEDARLFDAPPSDESTVPEMPEEQVELVELLLEKHPDAAKVVDSEKRLPLHLAAYSSVSPPPSLTRKMIDAFPGALERLDGDEKLPLHAACSAPLSSLDVIRTLTESYPDAVRRIDKDGALPIHLASWAGGRRGSETADTFRHLHGSYPDSVRSTDGDGDTALMIIVKYGRTSPGALEYVLGVDPDGPAAERKGASGKTSTATSSTTTTKATATTTEKAETKGTVSADPSSPGEQEKEEDVADESDGSAGGSGETVLHGALAGPGHEGTAEMLVRILALQPHLARRKDERGKLPLHTLLDHCCASLNAVRVLVEAYKDGVRTADGRDRLPLHHACRESVDDPGIVRYLLESDDAEGARVPDGSGALPLHLAIEAPSGRADEDEHGVPPMDYVMAALVESYPAAATVPDPRNGLLPLHAALRRHSSPVAIRSLVEGHPEAVRTPVAGAGGATALHVLAEERDEYRPSAIGEILDALLSSHPGGASIADDGGRLPLHATCRPANDVPPRRRRELEREREAAGWNATTQEVLLERLLKANPSAAGTKDGEGNLPLHSACKSHGQKVVLALLDAYPNGASVVSDETGLVPLQIACGALRPKYESYARGKEVDAIVGRLLELHPEGATVSGGKGDESNSKGLPLHLITASTALSPHLQKDTIFALIAANPVAVRTRDGDDNLPLHNAIFHRPHDTGKSTVLIRSLLREYPEATAETDSRGNLPLHIALTHARGGTATGSTYRRISKLLFDANPDAILKADSAGRLPAHRVAKIVGETGGVGKDMPGWVSLLREVLERNADALIETDDRGRTPLHCLCFALSDAVTDLAEEGRAAKTSSKTMEDLFRFLLTTGPGALDMVDGGGNKPRDIVEHDRQLGHLGEDRGELSATFTTLKRLVTKGSKYWKTISAMGQEQNVETEQMPLPKAGLDEL